MVSRAGSILTLLLRYCILPWICSLIAGKDEHLLVTLNKLTVDKKHFVLYYFSYSPHENN